MKKISYREAIREAIREEMRKEKFLFFIGQDVGAYCGEHRISGDLFEEFGEMRVRDAPISEQGIVGCALGASITGSKAIAEIPFMDFITLPMDQICNQAAKYFYTFGGQVNVPLVLRTAMGGYVTAAEQQSQCLEAWFVHVPGLKVLVPSTPYGVKGLLKTSICNKNPVIFIEHKYLYGFEGEIPEEEYKIPLGVADIKKEGVSIEVIDPRTLVPLDKEAILNSVKKTGKLIIVHEAPVRGGIGGEISAIVADECMDFIDAPIKRVGAKYATIPFRSVLERFVLPNEKYI